MFFHVGCCWLADTLWPHSYWILWWRHIDASVFSRNLKSGKFALRRATRRLLRGAATKDTKKFGERQEGREINLRSDVPPSLRQRVTKQAATETAAIISPSTCPRARPRKPSKKSAAERKRKAVVILTDQAAVSVTVQLLNKFGSRSLWPVIIRRSNRELFFIQLRRDFCATGVTVSRDPDGDSIQGQNAQGQELASFKVTADILGRFHDG